MPNTIIQSFQNISDCLSPIRAKLFDIFSHRSSCNILVSFVEFLMWHSDFEEYQYCNKMIFNGIKTLRLVKNLKDIDVAFYYLWDVLHLYIKKKKNPVTHIFGGSDRNFRCIGIVTAVHNFGSAINNVKNTLSWMKKAHN